MYKRVCNLRRQNIQEFLLQCKGEVNTDPTRILCHINNNSAVPTAIWRGGRLQRDVQSNKKKRKLRKKSPTCATRVGVALRLENKYEFPEPRVYAVTSFSAALTDPGPPPP